MTKQLICVSSLAGNRSFLVWTLSLYRPKRIGPLWWLGTLPKICRVPCLTLCYSIWKQLRIFRRIGMRSHLPKPAWRQRNLASCYLHWMPCWGGIIFLGTIQLLRCTTELSAMRMYENICGMDVAFTFSVIEEVEATLRTLLEVASWLDQWLFAL